MTNYIVFFRVDNAKEYTPYDFQTMSSEEIKKALDELPDEDVRIYELCVGYGNKCLSMSDFMDDYNHEELDGGWWCQLLIL